MLRREISIVIPVYNEQENIQPLIAELQEVLQGIPDAAEIVFVDDGSNDRSFALLREASTRDPRIRLIRFRKNAGQTAAFEAGFNAARGTIVVTMDADLQNDPHDIPLLLKKIGKFDVVCGWRYKRNDPWIRIVSSKIANFVRNKMSQEEIIDTGCSLKAFRRECVESMKLFKGMHRFFPPLAKMECFT